MSAAPQSAPPNPERIFNAINAYQLTEAIKAALDLGVFTVIANGTTTAPTIAQHVNASERGVRILCDYLTVKGFLTKNDGRYGLEPDTAVFLNRNSPAYMGSVANFLASDRSLAAHHSIADAVRQGGCAVHDPFDPDEPIWVNFARHMMPMMRMLSENLAAALTKEAPAHKVLDVATENAQQAGIADRHQLIPGSAFDTPFGEGYDLVLITNFLHHFDRATCISFLRKVHASLAPGGRAAILEFVPNPDRVTPPMPAAFSLIMLASTPSGDAYTFAELASMAQAAGFSRVIPSDAPVMPEQLILAYK